MFQQATLGRQSSLALSRRHGLDARDPAGEIVEAGVA
jgi:hypothetical protein